ncbi:MAG: AsmA family protein [Reyranella sp.]|uniref:AsmA family protein n=1 Tax=Reyranella sp. TaxID=1929291 RepID=UPI001ACB2D70|nr:AsmA family protein [Reyranella sp.]MBN9086001.1 AsmA family protein [Reyranella sp.]
MTTSMRRKLLIGAGAVLGVLIVALLVAPALIDVNKYKPQILAEVKKATGRELVIDGPLSLSLLPVPTATVAGVKFFNAPGSKNPNMVEVKSITVKPALFALLVGNIEVDEVTLVEPKIVLEINAEGKPNWEFTPSVAEAKPAAPKPSSPRPLSLGRLTIENGTLIFSDSKAGLSVVAEKADITASVGSIDGPYALAGSATVNNAPLKIDLSVGAKGSDGMPTALALEANGKLSLKGKISELGPNAKFSGTASVSAESLTGFIATLVSLAGQPVPPLPPLLASKFSFDGAVELSQSQIAARDFKIALAGDGGSGSLSVTLKPAPAIDGKLTLPKIDLDRVLAGLSAPPAPSAPGKPAPPAAPATGSGASVLDTLTAKLSLEAPEVIYNKQPVRNVALELDAKGGAVAVPKLDATLPGDMVLQARSTLAGGAVNGDFSLVGPKLRETLQWLAVDVSQVPASKLQKLSLKGRLGSSGGAVQVRDAAFELDDIRGRGSVTVTFSVPLSIVTQLDIDTVDLDSFMVKPADGQKKPAAPAATPAPSSSARAAAGPSVGLKLKLAKAIYNKETIGGIEVDLAMKGRTIDFRDVKVSNLGGARLAIRGTVTDYDQPLPRFDTAFNFEAPEMARVLKIAGATAPDGIGPVTARGGVSGTVEALTFRELDLAASGESARIDGTLTMPGAAKGQASTIGYKGKVTAKGQTIEGTVEAKVADRPYVSADLHTTTLDLDKLGSAPAPAAPRGRPAAAAPGQMATQTIDTGPLRAFDASFKLAAGTLISSPLRLGNADIAVTLKDGLLTLQHLKGGLYGGAVDLSGTIDGRKPAVAIDFKGSATGINLGEMLRATSGTNVFGGQVKVTVDGRLDATGIALTGAGSTREQIRGSMVGGAQLGGHVFVGADKALIALGSGAAGAVGGVIDNTLGNVLGVVGQRGIATNLLTAASVVLNRFVNRNNPISGHLDIAGGLLTDKGLAIAGDRATANIHTRTSLVASTTDTTVNLMIAEDPSAPYLVATVRGPLSSPSYGVSRGSAKDPPGVVNTLTNQVPSIIPGIPGLGGGGGGQRSPIPNIPIPNIFGR